ncbi:hypothetical protein F443_20614 [Phytophthora nicotianae P1569]|uniref:Uncharacterized protein n=1 Tax=Phytophthora nicotianae P1569 TaxID=1317065 RepID=V9E0K0_PHYNI|nr:hypothetical protein F443_20614 [Phytophthora nicotianae P1569]
MLSGFPGNQRVLLDLSSTSGRNFSVPVANDVHL